MGDSPNGLCPEPGGATPRQTKEKRCRLVENDATAAALYEACRRLREWHDGKWKDFALVRVGIGIGNMITGLGLDRVVVSGRIADAWQFVREPLNEAVARSMVSRVGGLLVELGERWSGCVWVGRSKWRPSTT